MSDFENDTTADLVAPGRFRINLSDRWWIGRGPNGGYVAALMLQAMSDAVDGEPEIADALPPRSLSVHFLSPPAVGEGEIEVTFEFKGHNTSFVSSRLVQEGVVKAKAMAVFSAERRGPSFDHTSMPSVPSPDGGMELDTSLAPVAVFSQYRAVPVIGGHAYSGGKRAETGGWLKLKDEQPMTAVLAAAMLDVWYPAPFITLTEQVRAPTLEYTVHFPRQLPTPDNDKSDWYLVRLTADEAHDGHFSEDGELWSRDGKLLARCRQMALLRDMK